MASNPRDVRPVVAIGLCLAAAILAWPLFRGDDHAATTDGRTPIVTPATPATGATREPRAERRADARPSGLPVSAPAPAAAPLDGAGRRGDRRAPASAQEVPEMAASAEERTGIAVFPPPGTDPPKSGIVVPEDYVLPDGYMRHYQATDDGKQLQPILVFHPDFQPVDDRGRPIPLPADRVVPPHLAPPGLPLDVLEVPRTEIPLVEHPPKSSDDPAS